VDHAHCLRSPEVGDAGDEAGGGDLVRQLHARRIVKFGYTVDREAPADPGMAAGKQSDRGARIGKMVVEVADLSSLELLGEKDAFSEMGHGQEGRLESGWSMAKREPERSEIDQRATEELAQVRREKLAQRPREQRVGRRRLAAIFFSAQFIFRGQANAECLDY